MKSWLAIVSAIAVAGTLMTGCNESAGDSNVDVRILPSTNGRTFGMHCQDSYQNGWLATFTAGFTMCDHMSATLTSTATQKFYFNLAGKQYYWHDTGDQNVNSLEDVDLFFSDAHGGAWQTTYAEWGMWDQSTLSTSDNMRLGDEAHNLSIFATYSCHVLQTDAYL